MKTNSVVMNSLNELNSLKIISGLNNFNLNSILAVTEAANIGGATYLDICADVKIIKAVKRNTFLPVCVSLTDPFLVEQSIDAGADLIELGNFDSLYSNGLKFSSNDIFNMTLQIKNQYPAIILCVTVPHNLSINDQIILSKKLEEIGVDIIQTEAPSLDKSNYQKVLNNISRASYTLSSTYAISKFVNIPIITSSNLSDLTTPLAISYGASGLGISKAIISLKDINLMSKKIESIRLSLKTNKNINLNYDLFSSDRLSEALYAHI
uniref:Uncharacterized protein ycf23 n=1 Tax=Flintiella sanguinaria TaxID=101926 RepID=A0A1X9PU95_9RHOD|nr:conserved hypothetical plastid protein [Flintiella sanguinaria]